MSHINCALSWCKNRPKYNRSDLEQEWGMRSKRRRLIFYHYKIMPTCSRCGLCSKDELNIQHVKWRDGRTKYMFREQKQLILKYEYFDNFIHACYIEHLQKYQKNFWKWLLLEKISNWSKRGWYNWLYTILLPST